MVSMKSLAATAFTGLLLPLASASATIYALSTPSTAAAGQTIQATLNTSIYIQNWEDFSIIWGLASPQYGGQAADGTIYVGTQVGYTALYGSDIEKLNSFTVDVTIPANQPAGDWLLVGAVPFLVGASGLTSLHSFNSTIKITA
ncbi:hypothetical protein F5Y19DRAFT_161903 [Xylariaceae sp. FL1651]|nr:hypothetical protein F5Y19DRAFT_161903 [Xylariaceae sp. FL1651]